MSKKKKTIDFAQNFNVLGPVQGQDRLIRNNTEKLLAYPDCNKNTLIASVSKRFHIPRRNIAIGNGATEIIFNLPYVLNGKKALIISPTFWEYEIANKRNKSIQVDHFLLKEENDFQLDFNMLRKKLVEDSVQTVYLCNPNNPTSTLLGKKELVRLIVDNPSIDFIVDETYLVFRGDYHRLSLSSLSTKKKNLYVVTSLSKIYNIPGLRIGFLSSNYNNIIKYNNYCVPFLNNPITEIVLPFILEQDEFIKKTVAFYGKQKNIFYSQLKSAFNKKLKILKPEANFILIKILNNQNSDYLTKRLCDLGIIIRNGSEFRELGNKWFRISVRKDVDNKEIIKQIAGLM